MNSARCLATIAAEAQPPRCVGVNGIEANKIAVIDKLAAGLATSVEARIPLRALAMKRQQAKPFDRPGRRCLAMRRKPDLQDRLADSQKLVGYVRRGGRESGVRRRQKCVQTCGQIVEALAGSLRHRPRPFARSKSEESEKFS